VAGELSTSTGEKKEEEEEHDSGTSLERDDDGTLVGDGVLADSGLAAVDEALAGAALAYEDVTTRPRREKVTTHRFRS